MLKKISFFLLTVLFLFVLSACNKDTTKFTVTFLDYDDTVIKVIEYVPGETITPPNDPIREGYTFTGWDKTFTNVQSDLTIKALYTKNEDSH